MRTLTRLAKKMDGPFGDHFLAEITKGRDNVLQAHLHRATSIHGQHIDRKTGLQACVAIELVQHHIARAVALDLNHHPHSGTVRFVADIRNTFNGLFTHKFANAFQQLRLVHLIGNFMNQDGFAVTPVSYHFSPRPHDHRTAPRCVGVADTRPSHDQRASRKIRARHDLEQFLDFNSRVANIGFACSNHLGRIMRRDVGGHAHGNTVGTIHQQIWIFSRQHQRFKLRFIVVRTEFDSFLVDVAQQAFGSARQSGFGISHRGRRIAINRPEISLPVNQRQSHREMLSHPDHGLINRAVAMRVIITHHVTDDTGRFTGRFRPVVIAFHHRIEDAAMHRLQPVTHIRQRPRNNHAHRVIEIGFPHFLGNRDGGAGRLGRGWNGVSQDSLFMRLCSCAVNRRVYLQTTTTSIPQSLQKPQNIVVL